MEPSLILPLHICYLNPIRHLKAVQQIARNASPFYFWFSHKNFFEYLAFVRVLSIVKACLVFKDHDELSLEPRLNILFSLTIVFSCAHAELDWD